jgi:hypothetical protein
MANNIKLKIGGVVYTITSDTADDVAKIQGAIDLSAQNASAIALLQTAVAENNQLQHIIAAADLGAQGATPSGLTAGALYDCYYNAAGRYLTYDKTTGTFSDEDVEAPATADTVPATLKVFPALTATTVASPRIYEMTSSFAGFVKTTGAQTVDGLKTFSVTPQSTAAQDLATLPDNELTKGSVTKGLGTRLVSAEGAITALQTSNSSKLSATVAASEPADEDLVEGVLTIYPAADRLTAASSGD